MTPPRASILIPVHRHPEGLRITLESLASSLGKDANVETVVCNDGGGEDISTLARQFSCQEARLPENRGSYAARNAGLQIAQAPIMAFLDADQRTAPGWLDAGLKAASQSEYVGGRVAIETSPTAGFWERFDQKNAFPVEDYIRRHYAPTANLFVHRAVFDKVGPFREDLRSGGDQEFGNRAFAAGFRQAYCPDAVTLHPARDRREQLIKLRRVATGAITFRLEIWKQRPSSLLAHSLLRLLSTPLRATGHLLRHGPGALRTAGREALAFCLIGDARTALYHYHLARGTLQWWLAGKKRP
jgi:GT2 family glycosyltransferase